MALPPVGDGMRLLRDILDIRLGGVTGDVRYFLLTESKRLKLKLPITSVRPVLSSAHHLIAGEMTPREWKALRDKDERVWLFDPPPRLTNHRAVRAYMELSPSSGRCRCDRYKIKSRDPWYRTPLPRHIDGFLSGMTRFGPWICLNAMSRLNATNTLYTIRLHESLTDDQKAAWALSFLTGFIRQLMQRVGRVYADGLLKYEPRDLLDLPLIVPQRVKGARAYYLEVIKVLVSGNVEQCQRMADYWFEHPIHSSSVRNNDEIGRNLTHCCPARSNSA